MSDLQDKPLLNLMPRATARMPSILRRVLDEHGINHEQLLPAEVVNYDRATNMATVKPLIMMVDVNDNNISRNQIANIPVMSMGGGGFHISFPLASGSLGWMLAADRDISAFLQNLKEAPPNTFRMHKFSDSVFIPDVYYKYTINSADENAMVIQSVDGTTRISISEGTINITAPTAVNVTTPLATFSQNVQINGNLGVTGSTTVTGQTVINGGLTATGSSGSFVTLPANTTINGITVATHGHISSSAGSRTSGSMIA